jgi:hypothetical protein
MGSYTDEPPKPARYGDLLFRAAVGLGLVACGAWVGLEVYPKTAMTLAVAASLAVVAITTIKAWRLLRSRN